ncbi:acyltransferase family protein [Eubacterium sp.]|uniref:acyltransferase family protein n=1 Tax=Eubacterium sp. TaxID=142586 RepID=UPI003F029BCA
MQNKNKYVTNEEYKKTNHLNYILFSKYRVELMGLAALMILYFHTNTLLSNGNYNRYYVFSVCQLNIGVEIFLIVSGIGLYFSLCKPNFSFRNYYVKRILNVYLIYLLIALPIILLHNLRFGGNIVSFLLDWSGIAFYSGKKYIFGNHGGWYVMFIMIIYLIYPFIFKVQRFLEKKKIDLLFLVLFTVSHIFICYCLRTYCTEIYSKIEVAFTRIPIFLIGSYIGKLVYNKNKFCIGTYISVASGIIVFIITTFVNVHYIDLRFNKMLLSFSLCVVFVIIMSFIKSETVSKILRFFGEMSLELYLTHNLANEFLFKEGHCQNHLQYLLIVLISIIVSYYISRLRKTIINKYNEHTANINPKHQ